MVIKLFNWVHLLIIALTILFPFFVYRLLRKKSQKTKDLFLLGLAVLNLGLYFVKILLMKDKPWFKFWDDLPLDLCNINLFTCIFAIIFKKKWIYNFLYFIATVGAFFAILFPNEAFLNCNILNSTIIYYVQHIILATFSIMLILLNYFKPSIKAIPLNTFILVILSIIIYGVNKMIYQLTDVQSNYFFLMRSPGNEVLDFFWQKIHVEFLYITPFLLIFIIINLIMCIPFLDRKEKRIA